MFKIDRLLNNTKKYCYHLYLIRVLSVILSFCLPSFLGFIILRYRCMLTLYQMAFALPQKSSRKGLLFTNNNGDFIAISLLKRSCTVPISKVESQYSVNWIAFQGCTKSYPIKCEHALNSRKMDGTCLGLNAKRATLKA